MEPIFAQLVDMFMPRPSVPETPLPFLPSYFCVVPAGKNRVRVLFGDANTTRLVRDALESAWEDGVASEAEYGAAYEFLLNGTPWYPHGVDAVRSRLVLCEVLHRVQLHNWLLVTALDASTKTTSKSAFVFRRVFRKPAAQLSQRSDGEEGGSGGGGGEGDEVWPRATNGPAVCVSFNSANRIRLLGVEEGFVGGVVAVVREAWAAGIESEAEYSGSYEVRVVGSPFQTKNLDEAIDCRRLVYAILAHFLTHHYTLHCAPRVSGKERERISTLFLAPPPVPAPPPRPVVVAGVATMADTTKLRFIGLDDEHSLGRMQHRLKQFVASDLESVTRGGTRVWECDLDISDEEVLSCVAWAQRVVVRVVSDFEQCGWALLGAVHVSKEPSASDWVFVRAADADGQSSPEEEEEVVVAPTSAWSAVAFSGGQRLLVVEPCFAPDVPTPAMRAPYFLHPARFSFNAPKLELFVQRGWPLGIKEHLAVDEEGAVFRDATTVVAHSLQLGGVPFTASGTDAVYARSLDVSLVAGLEEMYGEGCIVAVGYASCSEFNERYVEACTVLCRLPLDAPR